MAIIFKNFSCYGPPKKLLSNQGTHFRNEVVQELCDLVGTMHCFSKPYHPETNRLVERFNQTLINSLERLDIVNKENWDLYIPNVLWSYRIKTNCYTKEEPYKSLFSVEPNIKSLIKACENKFENRENFLDKLKKINAEKQLNSKEPSIRYKINYLVLVLDSKQKASKNKNFKEKWHGPYKVINILNHNVYQLSDLNDNPLLKLINGKRLKIYKIFSGLSAGGCDDNEIMANNLQQSSLNQNKCAKLKKFNA